MDEAVHTGKAGEPIIGLLKDSDHGLSLNSVLMYTAAADVETVAKESVENRANGIVAQLQTMSKKWSKYTKGKLPANLKALKQKKGLKPLKVYSGSTSATLKEDGSILFSGMVWFDEKGRMFENAAYVYNTLTGAQTHKIPLHEAALHDFSKHVDNGRKNGIVIKAAGQKIKSRLAAHRSEVYNIFSYRGASYISCNHMLRAVHGCIIHQVACIGLSCA